ncbi:MAG: cell division protein ZapA [Alphaproteobacteria bacterium]|nr:cell division protein ZapA [Alphaproteobacteria bacterium]
MAHVNVTIAGRAYRMACEDGQEPHLERLAQTIDQRINDMRKTFGEIGDQRLTVMAAISILDEASDLHMKIDSLEAELAKLKSAKAGADSAEETWANALAKALDDSAGRIERLARDLANGKEGSSP